MRSNFRYCQFFVMSILLGAESIEKCQKINHFKHRLAGSILCAPISTSSKHLLPIDKIDVEGNIDQNLLIDFFNKYSPRILSVMASLHND